MRRSITKAPVIRAARARLAQLEQQGVGAGAQGDLFAAGTASSEQRALDLLRETDPDALSPKEAHDLLYRLRQRLDE